jgi:chromosome segregation ATPase
VRPGARALSLVGGFLWYAGRRANPSEQSASPTSRLNTAVCARKRASERRLAREKNVTHAMDQLQKLEEKLSKVAEAFKRTQAENRSLIQQLEKLKADSGEGFRQRDSLEREIQTLRSEREDVRNRVAKLLEQVDALTKQDSAG